MLHSFIHALRGIGVVFKEERNFRIQMIAAAIAAALMLVLDLSKTEKGVIVLLIIIVLVLEMINSVLERLTDIWKPRLHDYVKDIKDIAAGMVFVASAGALAAGIIIFLPAILERINGMR